MTDFGLSKDELSALANETKCKALEIVARKGYTAHGIGGCVGAICENILKDRKIVMPVSVYHPSFDAHMGWPVVLGRTGVQRLLPVHLADDELERIRKSADVIKSMCEREYKV